MFFVDWIQFTIKVDTEIPGIALSYFYKVVDLEIEESELQRGFHGYRYACVFPSGIRIMFGGMPGMGINVTIPSKSMDTVHFTDTIENIEKKLKEIDRGYKWTRLDFAVDSHEVDFSFFYDKFIKQEYRCKYRKESIRQNVDANERGTLYFGKRGSLTMFRIYDKALESGENGMWTRIELETREEACEQLLKAYKENKLSQYFLGHLEFVKERKANMSRCETSEVYLKVIQGGGEKRKVERKESDKTLEWFVTQVAPTVKALKKYYGEEVVDKIIESAKMSKKQIKERFDIRVINKTEGANLKTGEIVKLSEEYIQLCLDFEKVSNG